MFEALKRIEKISKTPEQVDIVLASNHLGAIFTVKLLRIAIITNDGSILLPCCVDDIGAYDAATNSIVIPIKSVKMVILLSNEEMRKF